MIRISQIDDELSIYKDNTVVLLGLGNEFKQMFDLLQYHGIEVNCICDNNKDNWGTTQQGLKVISPPELKKMIECEDSNIVVQVSIKDMDEVTVDLLSNMGAKLVISFDEFIEFSSSLRKKHDSNIRISQIDDELSIYKNNTVVLLGLGNGVNPMLDLLNYHNIKVNFICDSNKENWGEIRHGYPVISPKHLELMADNDNIVVQVVSKNVDKKFIEEISNYNIKSLVTYAEAFNILKYMIRIKCMKMSELYTDDIKKVASAEIKEFRKKLRNHIIYSNKREFIITCLPQKTGNNTIKNTLEFNKITYLHLMHMPASFDKELYNNLDIKIKIITAVREPISQNLSGLYQHISSIVGREREWDVELSFNNYLFENGGDASKLFKIWCDIFCKEKYLSDNIEFSTFNLDNFFEAFKHSILDLSKHPFDKEEGYTIVKEGNLEVFVYQLEKMNNISKEMSDWIGQTSFDEWVMGNVSEEKWIANSYKQAQIDITFSKEHFNKCYNDPWVKHFYSDDDIEKFKDRWRPHIKD